MNLAESIGNTPLIELTKITPNPRVKILAKLEGCNPGGSVKDRTALYLIQKAEEAGLLSRDKIIIEPTSGNTGIALAMLCAAKGYKIKLVIPGCVSSERSKILQAYGAEVILTPADQGTDGSIREAHRIVEAEPDKYYMPDQFSSPFNPLAHYETTGPEIYRQTEGRLDAFVTGMGTTGTLMGISQYLKEQNPAIQIVGVEPVVGHKIQGLKNMQEAIVPPVYHPDKLDRILTVEDDEAFEITRRLATEEGIFVGMSSGASVVGAIKLAQEMQEGTIVALLPDRGDRYLSTTLFRSVCSKCAP